MEFIFCHFDLISIICVTKLIAHLVYVWTSRIQTAFQAKKIYSPRTDNSNWFGHYLFPVLNWLTNDLNDRRSIIWNDFLTETVQPKPIEFSEPSNTKLVSPKCIDGIRYKRFLSKLRYKPSKNFIIFWQNCFYIVG